MLSAEALQIQAMLIMSRAPRFGETAWSVAKIVQLVEKWHAGETTMAIAQDLGLTKNSVVGFQHRHRIRLGMTKRPSPIRREAPNQSPIRRETPGPDRRRAATKSATLAPALAHTPPASPSAPVEPVMRRLSNPQASETRPFESRPIKTVEAGALQLVDDQISPAIAKRYPGRDGCRWPLNNGVPWVFCCAHRDGDENYCREHHRQKISCRPAVAAA